MVPNNERMPDLNRAQVIMMLRSIREEWETACNGLSPIEVKASAGLLLNDVVNAIGFEPAEKAAILGASLVHEVERVC